MGNGMAHAALTGIRPVAAERRWHLLSAETETLFGLGVPLVGIDTTPPVSRALWTSINLVERKVGEIAADELIATGRR